MQNHYWRIFYRNLIIFYCAWTQYTKKVFYVTQTPLKKVTLPRLYYLVPLVLTTKTITTTRSWNSWQDQNNLKQCCTVRPLVGWWNFYDEKGRYTRTRVWYINYKIEVKFKWVLPLLFKISGKWKIYSSTYQFYFIFPFLFYLWHNLCES